MRQFLHHKRFTFAVALLIALLASVLFSQTSRAQNETSSEPVIIYFFWGDGCPHCAEAKPVLIGLSQQYPNVELRAYELYYVDSNRPIVMAMAAKFGTEAQYVPEIFIGERYWMGYNDAVRDEIVDYIGVCLQTGCPDAGEGINMKDGVLSDFSSIQPTPQSTPEAVNPGNPGSSQSIKIPLFGTVDLSHSSLFLSTLLISFVDGFNPCSLWVLSMLLALTLHTGSRKKVIIIGLVFITVTAAVYALFIAGLFTMFTFISFIGWIQVLVALIAMFFALVNIKDYFWYKEGLSFTIDDSKKPGIFQRIRKVMDASENIWAMVGATIVLALGVSMVEFSCTAGFPVLWTNLVSAQKVTPLIFGLLLLTYMVIYQLDELAIFFTAAFTLKAGRLEEKQGRILKLIGGMLMLTLAVVMLVNPQFMNDVGNTLLIFLIAAALTGLVLLLHRVILPKYGIWIGTESQQHRKKGRKAPPKRH